MFHCIIKGTRLYSDSVEISCFRYTSFQFSQETSLYIYEQSFKEYQRSRKELVVIYSKMQFAHRCHLLVTNKLWKVLRSGKRILRNI